MYVRVCAWEYVLMGASVAGGKYVLQSEEISIEFKFRVKYLSGMGHTLKMEDM